MTAANLSNGFSKAIMQELYKEIARLDILRKTGRTNQIRLKADTQWGAMNSLIERAKNRYVPPPVMNSHWMY